MKIRIGTCWTSYCNRAWLPILAFLCLLGASVAIHLPRWKWLAIPADILTIATLVSLGGILAAGIRNLVRRQWRTGLLDLLALLLAFVAWGIAMSFLMFYSMFGPSEDGFADSLEIPRNLAVAEPWDEPEARPGAADDTFQRALLDALSRPGGQDPAVTASLPALAALQQRHPDILARYLRCSSAWRVFTEDGNLFATRRWTIGSERQYTLHGYYTQHSLNLWPDGNLPEFQSRVTLGLSGKPWWRGNENSTWLQAGDSAQAKLSQGNQMLESHCVMSVGGLVVEIFEQSQAKERRLTKAALEQIEAELAPLAAQPTEETLRALLPKDSIRLGEPSLDLQDSFQPGLYDSHIWINPGEPGMLYLKAFEATRGTPLSVDRLNERSGEWVGWSDNPGELFLSNTHFTIYEGDWGKPYAARFEAWFAPGSGAPERKLLEKVFKIEGWQR